MSEVIEHYPALCFSLRHFEDEITAKLAVQYINPDLHNRECSKHELLNAYPVLIAPNEIVAQFTITAAILSTSTVALTGLPIDEAKLTTTKKIEDEAVLKILNVHKSCTSLKGFDGKEGSKKIQEDQRTGTTCCMRESPNPSIIQYILTKKIPVFKIYASLFDLWNCPVEQNLKKILRICCVS